MMWPQAPFCSASTRCRPLAAATATALVLAGCATPPPPERSAALIARAEAALGSATLKTLTVTGRGSAGSVGQSHEPGGLWPAVQLRVLQRTMNFETAAFREEFIRSRAEPLGGGALPPMGAGESRGVVLAREGHAWDVVGVATPAAPASLPARVHDLWLTTPQGALKAAARAGAQAGERREDLRRWDTLSFQWPGQFSATLLLEDEGLVSSIEARVPHPLLGELPVLTRFADYRPIAGLMLPSRIVQDQGGFVALDLQIVGAEADAAVDITIPDNVRSATETVAAERLADGVWLLGGGTHHSVAVEQAGQTVVVELPLHPARARAVLDAAQRLAPTRRVRSVIATHHHFDHAGGLRVAAADGLTVHASRAALPWLAAQFAGTLRLAGVAGSTRLDDAARPVEIHELPDSPHARGLLLVWLPRQQLLVQADAYTPGPPDAPPQAVPDPAALNLVHHLDRLGLKPRRVVSLHGRVVPVAELYAQVGRRPPP